MSRKESALDEVRKVIFRGDIRAGEILSERVLTEKYLSGTGLGRTPVREALTILTEQGVIEQYPQVGFTVRVIDADEADKALRLQEITEGYVVTEAARTGLDPGESLRGAAHMRDAAKNGDSMGFLDLARSYHADLTRAADYASAVDAIEGFRDRFALYIATTESLTQTELFRAAETYEGLAKTIGSKRDPAQSRAHLQELIDTERSFVDVRSKAHAALAHHDLATAR